MDRFDWISQSILTDEIGIRTGRVGEYRVKSFFRPVYRRCRGQLVPVGVTSSWLPTKAGRPVDRDVFFESAGIAAQSDINQFSNVLALCNLENTGVETLDLHVVLDLPDWNDGKDFADSVRNMLHWLDVSELGRDQVVFCLSDIESCEHERLRDHAARLRDQGIRIGLKAVAEGLPDSTVVEIVQPEIATIDGAFLDRIAAVPETRKLFDVLLGQFRQFGTAVHLKHLDSPGRLLTAFDTRADLLQGDLLAMPDLAGTCFPTEALSVLALARSCDEVAVMRG